MACAITLTKSRKLNCIQKTVGVRALYIVDFNPLDRVATASTGVASLPDYITTPVTPSVARFDVKATTINYTDTLTNNMDTRSGGRKGELPIILSSTTGLDNVTLAEVIDQITKTEFLGFLELKNGDIFAIGSQFGCMVSTAVDTTGGQSGDLNGITLTIQTDEAESFRKFWLTPAAIAELVTATLPY